MSTCSRCKGSGQGYFGACGACAGEGEVNDFIAAAVPLALVIFGLVVAVMVILN